MNWGAPEPWEFALLTLAIYRVWRLLSQDTLLDRPRAWLLGGEPPPGGASDPPGYRGTLAYWLLCPYCCGAWITLGWWLAWLAWPDGTVIAAAPWALSGAVAVFAAHLDP